jgi:transcriptional regulator with XRE-family HTH domain
MNAPISFGYWIHRQRKALDLTQEDLAQCVGCAVVTIRKIEADERRPSVQVAQRLADCLSILPEERTSFLHTARPVLAVDQLATLIVPPVSGPATSETGDQGQLAHFDALGAITAPSAGLSNDIHSPRRGQTDRPRSAYAFLDKGHPDDYRSEEIQKLALAIAARENRLVLGLPGMGISNLLRFLVARREEIFESNIVFAYLNCNMLDSDCSIETFFEAICGELQDQGLDDATGHEARGYERLKRLVTQIDGDPSRRGVIIVDQANALLPKVDAIFYRKLNALTELNKRLCYIFAAHPRNAAIADPENLLFVGRRLSVGRMNQRDRSAAIAEEARRLRVEFSEVQQIQLASLTGGHPGLLRTVSSAAVMGGLDLWGPESVAAELLLTRDDVRARCQRLWDALDPEQQAALRLIAGGWPAIVATNMLAWLRDFGLVEQYKGAYPLFSPIFERFVAAQTNDRIAPEPVPASAAPARTAPTPIRSRLARITIRQPTCNEQGIIIAGKVFKGTEEVYIRRRSLRLLACLRRERKIYTKHEIADYVYFEDHGVVSDSAIQSLVKEVRGKLGQEYIKTHWGQGYELVQGDDDTQ